MKANLRALLSQATGSCSEPFWATRGKAPESESEPQISAEPEPEDEAPVAEIEEAAEAESQALSELAIALIDNNTKTIRSIVQSGDADDFLVQAREAEASAKNRTTVLDAIGARLHALNEVESL